MTGRAVLARRRRVVAAFSVVGAGLLGRSLSTEPGSRSFLASTGAVAATWVVGGLSSGPLHLGSSRPRNGVSRRPVVAPVALGIGAFGVFYGAALVARRVPVLGNAISRVLDFANQGVTPLVLLTTCANGVGEEVFFRGAVYAAMGDRHPAALSTAIYTVAALPTRNPALVLAAGLMGSLFAEQRRASGGILAPSITHLTWSVLMVRFLPPLFREPGGPASA